MMSLDDFFDKVKGAYGWETIKEIKKKIDDGRKTVHLNERKV